MITDLVQIQRLGEKKLGENEKFRRYLKSHKYPELRLRKVAEEIEAQIDCRACASCCKVAETDVTEKDVERLARHIGTTPKRFIEEYTTTSAFEDKETILRRTKDGCIFLDGNDCTVYEKRPDTCRYFPHIVRGQGPLTTRMWQLIDRATYCPIVYNSLEKFKEILGYRNSAF